MGYGVPVRWDLVEAEVEVEVEVEMEVEVEVEGKAGRRKEGARIVV